MPRDKTETDSATWERLKKFRAKVEKKHTCVYWKNADELKARVIIGLTAAAKRHPAVGWVRADNLASEATLLELLALKNRVAELESEAVSQGDKPPSGIEELAQGDDQFDFHVTFRTSDRLTRQETEYKATITPSWDAIFAAVAPSMIHEAPERTLKQAFQQFVIAETKRTFENQDRFKDQAFGAFVLDQQDVETCIIQLRALGLIKPNDKKRSVHDKGIYWTLTPYGNTMVVQLRAIRKDPVEPEVFGEIQTSVADDN